MLILTVTGTPARGPGSYPRANAASTRSACSRTRSGRQSTIALIRGLTESSRCSAASVTSRADALPVLTRRATSLADRRQSSLIEGLLCEAIPTVRGAAASFLESLAEFFAILAAGLDGLV